VRIEREVVVWNRGEHETDQRIESERGT
jgi:hypothetical protein